MPRTKSLKTFILLELFTYREQFSGSVFTFIIVYLGSITISNNMFHSPHVVKRLLMYQWKIGRNFSPCI